MSVIMVQMKQRILDGLVPVEALKELVIERANICNHDLSCVFADKFMGLSSESVQTIWY